MEFKDTFAQYLNRVTRLKEQLDDLTEEATKNALIMPFFSMLGYDVFNTDEFMPEFVCDVGTKKGEKVDYALLKDGEPVILIEAKRAGMKLQKQQQSQLYRYFTVNRCRLAVLTNGITYQIFSDINVPNIMDDEPFLSFNLLEDDPAIYMSAVKQFSKEQFDIKNILSKAIFQKYEKVVIKTLQQDLLSPSDEIVKYFLLRPEIKTGNRITSQMIEKHREITKKAMQKVFGAVINNNALSQNTENLSINAKNDVTKIETSSQQEIIQPTLSPIEQIKATLTEYQLQDEDNPNFFRLHVYNSSGKKLGIVKILKPDMNIQFKIPGNPTMYEINSVEEIKSYL
ncbi:MAG: type I restriction enzyme HsdR N-terminal domain-containing protein [Lachnospiraceae bacterium]|nr:type I restriction enzyme HsdR N-terminal domain-containing protein [Lachnospiraceae bacterium]